MNISSSVIHVEELFFGISPFGGILVVLVFLGGWFFGDFILKKSKICLKLSLIGFITLIIEILFLRPVSIFKEHLVIFCIGVFVSLCCFLIGKLKK